MIELLLRLLLRLRLLLLGTVSYDQRPHPSPPRLVFWPVGGIEVNKVYLSVQ